MEAKTQPSGYKMADILERVVQHYGLRSTQRERGAWKKQILRELNKLKKDDSDTVGIELAGKYWQLNPAELNKLVEYTLFNYFAERAPRDRLPFVNAVYQGWTNTSYEEEHWDEMQDQIVEIRREVQNDMVNGVYVFTKENEREMQIAELMCMLKGIMRIQSYSFNSESEDKDGFRDDYKRMHFLSSMLSEGCPGDENRREDSAEYEFLKQKIQDPNNYLRKIGGVQEKQRV